MVKLKKLIEKIEEAPRRTGGFTVTVFQDVFSGKIVVLGNALDTAEEIIKRKPVVKFKGKDVTDKTSRLVPWPKEGGNKDTATFGIKEFGSKSHPLRPHDMTDRRKKLSQDIKKFRATDFRKYVGLPDPGDFKLDF